VKTICISHSGIHTGIVKDYKNFLQEKAVDWHRKGLFEFIINTRMLKYIAQQAVPSAIYGIIYLLPLIDDFADAAVLQIPTMG
jgi:hypothetical protein